MGGVGVYNVWGLGVFCTGIVGDEMLACLNEGERGGLAGR